MIFCILMVVGVVVWLMCGFVGVQGFLGGELQSVVMVFKVGI